MLTRLAPCHPEITKPEMTRCRDDQRRRARRISRAAHRATGFMGQAMVERLLSSYPDTRVSVLIRPRGGRCAAERLTALLRKNVFRSSGERLGADGLAAATRRRRTRQVWAD